MLEIQSIETYYGETQALFGVSLAALYRFKANLILWIAVSAVFGWLKSFL